MVVFRMVITIYSQGAFFLQGGEALSEKFVLINANFMMPYQRYKWQLKHLPGNCACGKPFTIDHALSCAKGGFIYQRHKRKLWDTIAKMIDEVRNDVTIEPRLEPISSESLNKGAIKSE